MNLTLDQRIEILAPAYAEQAGVSIEDARIHVREILTTRPHYYGDGCDTPHGRNESTCGCGVCG